MTETKPKVIQRITMTHVGCTDRQTIVRTSSGEIDYAFYSARARRCRAEAFARFASMLRHHVREVMRSVFKKTAAWTSDCLKADCG